MAIDPNRVKEIFLGATEQQDEAARAAYLDRACGGDAGLRGRVEALLRSHDPAGSFLGNPAVTPPAPNEATQDLSVDGGASPDDGASAAEDLQFLSPSTRADSLGRLGHYEVLQVLGRGGFGIVFRAFDEMLQRVVAVKVMAPQIATLSPARKRFLREARSSAAVRHENVVHVYEVGEQPLPYLVMEFVPGETLQQKLDRSGPLDVPEVLRIGRQIAEGLAAAHASDLIHRDIKPGNILLEGGSHRAKITDFGLARAADDASISQSGVIAGTPLFMSPEQALGHHIDQRADLFSFGSVLYQMVSGRPPFRAPSALAVLKRVAEEPPRPIPEIIPETPDWLCGIIAKLHAKNPDDRFQSAREVADLLADCEARLKAKQEVKNVLPAAVKPVPRRSRRIGGNRKWAAAVALVLLLGAGWFGRAAMLYVENSGELEFLPQEGLVSVIVLQNDEGVIDGNKLHAPVTDWLDMKKSHTLKLPPGRYQLNVGTWPAGIHVSQWAVTTSGPFRSHQVTVPVINTSAIVTVERGHRVTLLAVMRDRPRPVPVAKQEPLPPTFKNGMGMEFVIVPKGKSWLGGGKDKVGDKEVEIPADFYLGKYEVTQAEWEKVMGENPSHFSRMGGGMVAVKDISDADLKRFPVDSVSWDQCQIFVAKLNKLEKQTGWVYRLPTEAEWEYACRGGPMSDKVESAFDFYFAKPTNTLLPEQANFEHGNGLKRPCKVGSYEPNPLGLCDMHGNVWEWCDDTEEATDGASHRLFRAGAWGSDSGSCRATGRSSNPPSDRFSSLGLRLARVPSGAPSPETPPMLPAVAPFTDADAKRIAALPAAQQVEEVRRELKKRNPEFDGQLRSMHGLAPKIKDGVVVDLRFRADTVSDISPLRALTGLCVFHCCGSEEGIGRLSDLSSLKGMPLTEVWIAQNSKVTDLSPLQGMRLSTLHVGRTGVKSIEIVKEMPISRLWIVGTPVADLSPLAGKSLEYLNIARTVKSLKELRATTVKTLGCDPDQVADEAELQRLGVKDLQVWGDPKTIDSARLRALGPRLKKINDKPAEEFFKIPH